MTVTRPQQLLRRLYKLIFMRHGILFCLDYRVGAIGGRRGRVAASHEGDGYPEIPMQINGCAHMYYLCID